jgi:hypothetical protein
MARRNPGTAIAPPFRFLDLPREVRDKIYQMLLTTPYTDVGKEQWDLGCTKNFNLHAGILFANRQLYNEARETFFFDNTFIVLKIIGGWTTFNYISTVNLPSFHNLKEEMIERSVLTATLEELGPEEEFLEELYWPSHRKDTCKTVITTPDALFSIKEGLWNLAKKGMNFRDWSLHIDVQPSLFGRAAALRDQVLSQCDQIQGFRRLTLTGDIAPPLSGITSTADLLIRTGEDYFQQRRFGDARIYFNHAKRFLSYRYNVLFRRGSSAAITAFFHHDHIPFLKATLPLVINAHIGLLKLDLLHFEEKKMNSLGMRKQINFVEDLIGFFERDCDLNPVLVARFHVCNAMAHLAVGHGVAALAALAQVRPSVARDERYKENAIDLVLELDFANFAFKKELQKQAREAHFRVILCSSEPPAIDPRELARRSFWEWLNVVEEALPYTD